MVATWAHMAAAQAHMVAAWMRVLAAKHLARACMARVARDVCGTCVARARLGGEPCLCEVGGVVDLDALVDSNPEGLLQSLEHARLGARVEGLGVGARSWGRGWVGFGFGFGVGLGLGFGFGFGLGGQDQGSGSGFPRACAPWRKRAASCHAPGRRRGSRRRRGPVHVHGACAWCMCMVHVHGACA